MARNSLKSIFGDLKIDHILLTKRPEELSVNNFIEITKLLESSIKKKGFAVNNLYFSRDLSQSQF